jgi:hypothetical protein
MTDYTPGQYRVPAVETIAPPPGGVFWFARLPKPDAALLLQSLLNLPYPPDVAAMTWPGKSEALVLVDQPMANATGVKLIMQMYTNEIQEWPASLDVTGWLARGRKAVEACHV